jgi:hypothetical protein
MAMRHVYGLLEADFELTCSIFKLFKSGKPFKITSLKVMTWKAHVLGHNFIRILSVGRVLGNINLVPWCKEGNVQKSNCKGGEGVCVNNSILVHPV